MKRKTRILFSALILTITLLLSVIAIRAFIPSSNGDNSDAEVAASAPGATQIAVEFKVYDPTIYDERKNILPNDIGILLATIASGYGANKFYDHAAGRQMWNGTFDLGDGYDYTIYSTPDPSKSCAEYYGIPYPFTETATVKTCTEVSGLYDVPQKNDFSEGEEIIIEINMKTASTFNDCNIFIIGKDTNGSSDKYISDALDNIEIASTLPVANPEARANSIGGFEGWTFGGTNQTTPYDGSGGLVVGTIKGEIKVGAPSFSIAYQNNILSKLTIGMTSYNGSTSTVLIGDPFTVTLAGPSTTTDIEVEYDGSAVPTGSGVDYKLDLDPTKASTSINLDIEALDKAKIIAVAEGATAAAATSALASASAMSATTHTQTLTAGARGESKFIAVRIQAEDTSVAPVDKVIEVFVKKNNKNTLDGLSVGLTSGQTSTYTPNLAPAFSSTTTTYTLYVADDATSVDITPTYNNYQDVKINGVLTNSGTGQAIDVSTVSSFTVVVTPEDGGTAKTYTFTVSKKSTTHVLENPTNHNPGYLSVVAGGTTYNPVPNSPIDSDGPWTYDTLPYKSGGTINSSFKVKINDVNILSKMKVELFDNVSGTSYGQLNASGESNSISFGSNTATQKVLKVVITAEAGGSYVTNTTLTVDRAPANTDSGIDTDAFYVVNANTSSTLAGTWDTAKTTYTVTNPLPYKEADGSIPAVNFVAILNEPTLASAKSGTSTPLSDTYNSGASSATYVCTGNSLTIYLDVYSEAYDGSSNFTRYTIKLTKTAASTNSTATNFKVTDHEGNEYTLTTTPGLTPSGSKYTISQELAYSATSGIKVYLEFDPTATAQIWQGSSSGGAVSYASGAYSAYYYAGSTLSDIEVTIKVTAQDPSATSTYTFVAKLRTPDDDKTVSLSTTLSNSVTYNFNQNLTTFNWDNSGNKFPYGTTEPLTLNFNVVSHTTKVVYGGKEIMWDSADKTITVPTGWNPSTPITVTIKTEANPTGTPHTITFYNEAANDDHGMGYQTVTVKIDGNPVTLTLNTATKTYESPTSPKLPYPNGEVVEYKVETSVPTNQILDSAGGPLGNSFVSFPYSGANPTTTFIVKTQAGMHTYTIKLNTELPSDNKNLTVQLFGENTPTAAVTPAFDPATNTFTFAFRKTIVGEKYTAQLSIDPTAKLYVSTISSTNPTDNFDPTTLWNIGNKLYVKVVAQDSTSIVYTIDTSFVNESDDAYKRFEIDGTDVTAYEGAGKPVLYLPYSTTSINAEVEANNQFSTVEGNNGSIIYIGNKTIALTPGVPTLVSFTITAAATPTVFKTYSVMVQRDADNTINDIKVFDPDGTDKINYAGGILTGTVPYKHKYVKLEYELAAEADGSDSALDVTIILNGVTYAEGAQIPLSVGANNIIFNVKTKSGVNLTKNITITQEPGSSVNTIATYTTEDGTVHNNFEHNNNFTYRVDKAVLVFNPTVILTDPDNSTFAIKESNKNLIDGRNQFTIEVTAEDGNINTYNITVFRADNNHEIVDIEVVDSIASSNDVLDVLDNHAFVLDKTILSQTKLTVGNPVSKVYIKVTFESKNAKVSVKGSKYGMDSTSTVGYPVVFYEATLVEGVVNSYEIYVESEYAGLIAGTSDYANEISAKYTVNIERKKADNDATLQSLVVTDSSGNVLNFTSSFNPTTKEYTITNVGSITSINIQAIPTLSTTDVNIQGVDVFKPDYTTPVSLPALGDTGSTTNYIFDRYIYTTAEDGTKLTYKIIISRDEVNLDSDTDVLYYRIFDEFNTEHFGQANFNTATTEYNVTVPFGVNSITFEGVKSTTYSPLTFEGTGLYTILPEWLGTTKTFTVNSKAADGTKGTSYKFNVTFEAPVYVDTLDDIKIDGTSIPGFDPEILEYNYGKVPYAKAEVDVTAILSDPNAEIVNIDDLTDFPLNVGNNTVIITVKSQGGKFKTYKVFIEREPQAAELLDLYVADTVLRDLSQNVTTFTPAVKDYMAIVPWDVASTSITVKVPNPAYITSCNSSTINSGEYRTFDNLPLVTGNNVFTINAISTEGTSVNYTVTIVRRPQPSSDTSVDKINMDCFDVNSKLIPVEEETLEKDYTNTQTVYNYKVPNKVTNVKINLIPSVIGDVTTGSLGSTYEVYNNTNFQVGMNTVVVVVTAEDGVTTKHIIINIEREKMAYTVNPEAYEKYKLTTNEDGTYTLDLGNDIASSVEDYTKYIVTNPDDNLTVEVLSDVQNKKCSEVVLKITDGDQTEYVKVLVQTTATDPGIKFDPIWIFFGLAVLMLIVILICVNRDKYGSINKSRKRIKE